LRRARRFRYPRAVMDVISGALEALNAVLWHESVLYVIVAAGHLFTFWSMLYKGFRPGRMSQLVAVGHGTQVVRGVYGAPEGPGGVKRPASAPVTAAISAARSGPCRCRRNWLALSGWWPSGSCGVSGRCCAATCRRP